MLPRETTICIGSLWPSYALTWFGFRKSHSLVAASSNLWQSSCLSLPNAGITSMSYDTQLQYLTPFFSSCERESVCVSFEHDLTM